MTTENAIQLISSKIRELNSVRTPDDFISWRDSTVQRLHVICPNKPIIRQIAQLRPTTIYGGDSLLHKITPQVKKMLESLTEDINIVGIETYHKPDTNESSSVTVNNSNTQSQNQVQEQKQKQELSLSFEFVVECLKKGLRDTEIDELKDILESQDEPKLKKKKFSEKLLSFGSDVSSNILANILTNPQVYDQLGGIL